MRPRMEPWNHPGRGSLRCRILGHRWSRWMGGDTNGFTPAHRICLRCRKGDEL